MKNILFFFAALEFLAGCNYSNKTFSYIDEYKEYITPLPNKENGSLVLSEFSFPISDTISDDDFEIFRSKDSLVYLYSVRNKKAYFFSENTNQELFQINLSQYSKQGDVYDIYYHNNDTIFVFQESQIKLINNQGVVIKYWDLLIDDSTKIYYGRFSEHFPLYFNPLTKKIYLERYNSDCTYDHEKCLGSSLECAIDIETDKMDTLSIEYPNIFKKNLGFLRKVDRAVCSHSHVYSFFGDPNLYSLNLSSGELHCKGGKSRYHHLDVLSQKEVTKDTLNDNELMKMFMTYPQYYALYYDDRANLFYRVFYQEIREKKENGLYSEFNEKKEVIMLFDTNLNLIDEVVVPNKGAAAKGIITKHGLTFRAGKVVNRRINFYAYKYKK